MPAVRNILAGAALVVLSSVAQAERITLCADQTWYPFTFLESYKASGIFVDIAKEVGKRADLRVRVRAIDWNKCKDYARSGKVDGILGASHSEDRAAFMEYPMKANQPDGAFSLGNLEYVVVTMKSQKYQYNGNPKSIPQPVRVPAGFSIAKDLRAEGLKVDDTTKGDQANLINLSKEKTGCVVMLRELANVLVEKSFFNGQLSISEKSYKGKLYYLTFSKKSSINAEMHKKLWKILSEVRQDKDLINSYISKYEL